MKHTLVHWKTCDRFTGNGNIPIGKVRPDGIATDIFAEVYATGGVTGESEADANARLIASAPVLLDALILCREAIQRLAKESPDGVPMWASEAHDSARTAISTATI